MGTRVVSTVVPEEMNIAQLHVAYFVYQFFVVYNWRIDALKISIAGYIVASCRVRKSRLRCWGRRDQLSGSGGSGSPTGGFRVHDRSVAWCRTGIRAVGDGLIR